MKKNFIYCVLIPLLLLASCKTKKEKIKKETPPPQLSQLVNWKAMSEKGRKNMSFPIWFSKDKIDTLNIKKIKLTFSSFNFTDTNLQSTDTLPYQLITIDFKDNGAANKVVIDELSSGMEIAKNTFTYKSSPDDYGYTSPNVSSQIKYGGKNILSFVNTLQELQQYKRLIQEEKDSTLLKFIDKSSSEKTHHYFILDSANWNVTYLDQHFSPTGKNIFYYGSPKHYITSFSLKNLVEKTKREERSFYSTGTLKTQFFHKDGFITKRYYQYDSLGLCTGFMDSLVTKNDEFLHLEKGRIQYKQEMPKTIGIYNEEDSLMNEPIKKVRFSYTFEE